MRSVLPEISRTTEVEWNFIQRKPANPKTAFRLNGLIHKGERFYSYFPIVNRIQRLYDFIHIFFWALATPVRSGDRVWVVLENDMIGFAYYLIRLKGKFRLHISVHDDCRINYPSLERNDEMKIQYILRYAESVDVIGRNLQKLYQHNFGVRSIIFRRGVALNGIRQIDVRTKYRLIFVGSSHSDKSWETLFNWMESAGKVYSFELDAFTYHDFAHNLRIPSNLHLRVRETVDEDQLMEIARGYDLSVFFWNDFDKNRLKYSVSTKLTTYLRLGLPLLASIDRDAEVFDLFERGVAFNIDEAESAKFEKWIGSTDFARCFASYVSDHFNKKNLDIELLSLPFFKN